MRGPRIARKSEARPTHKNPAVTRPAGKNFDSVLYFSEPCLRPLNLFVSLRRTNGQRRTRIPSSIIVFIMYYSQVWQFFVGRRYQISSVCIQKKCFCVYSASVSAFHFHIYFLLLSVSPGAILTRLTPRLAASSYPPDESVPEAPGGGRPAGWLMVRWDWRRCLTEKEGADQR